MGKMANFDFDMQQRTALDSGIIKKLISSEGLVAKALYRQPITFVPNIKLLIATNSLPNLDNIDQSITRRFIFLELKNSFKGKENFNLKEELLKEKNLIFARGIHGAGRLIAR